MKKYLTYKASKIPWVKEIPASWLEDNLKHLGHIDGSTIDKKTDLRERVIRLINYIDVYNNTKLMINEDINFMLVTANEDQIKKYKVEYGDVLFTPSSETANDIGHSAIVQLKSGNIDTCFSYHLIRFKPKKHIFDFRYLKYLFNNNFVLQYFSSECKGTTRQILNRSTFNNLVIPIPDLKIQKKLASYLDNKTNQIESLVSSKQKLINLLKEKRVAIINDAAIKGVNQKVNYKKSELGWLSIPEHWKEIRAKNVFFESQDKAKGHEELLSVSHYTGITPRREKNVNMFLADSYEGYKLCKKDDLVINTMWAWMGALGISKYDGIVSSGYGVYRFKNKNTFIPMFLNYLLRIPGYVGEYTKRSKGIHSSRWRLYADEFFQITIICPPLEEQRKIVSFIIKETQKIDQSVIKIEKEIALLIEYKNSLISEVVSGQIDVRDEVLS
jgi:type I restriction enzyme, S subunit